MEKGKKELEQTMARKERDIAEFTNKLGEEQSVVSKLNKAIKETQVQTSEEGIALKIPELGTFFSSQYNLRNLVRLSLSLLESKFLRIKVIKLWK